jgi:hypothetical protein
MLFTRWFRRSRPTQASGRPTRTCRPAVLALEDRTVPSGFGLLHPGGFGLLGESGFGQLLSSPSSTPGPATHLQVIVPNSVQSGQTFNVLVEAEDASNRLASGYTGTVQLSLGTADSGATLPAAYTFTTSDHGRHLFQVSLAATGSQTITATDTTTSSITGSATTTVNPAPTLTQLLVVTPETAAVGVPTRVTVAAVDASGHLLRNFTGTVSLSTSDSAATGLPSSYTFTASDRGVHTFDVTFGTADAAGSPTTVTATDGSVTGQASLTVDPATEVTHSRILALRPSVTGSSTAVLVQALNASNQVVTGYTGTIQLTSSDAAATATATAGGTATALPLTYTFTSADAGAHTFYVTFGTAGQQTLTVTDTNTDVTTTANVPTFSHNQPHGWWW